MSRSSIKYADIKKAIASLMNQKSHSIVDDWYTTADAVYRSKLIRAYVAALAQWLEEETEPVRKEE